MLHFSVMDSPVGPLTIVASGHRLLVVHFGADRAILERPDLRRHGTAVEHPDPGGGVSALAAYFEGDLDALQALSVDPAGSPFQQHVWQALRSIRPGRTASYGEIAAAIGNPAAVRAVGAANGANPIAIVVPCHRIIGAGGSLVGYGGGLDRKRWLLEHEGVLLRM